MFKSVGDTLVVLVTVVMAVTLFALILIVL